MNDDKSSLLDILCGDPTFLTCKDEIIIKMLDLSLHAKPILLSDWIRELYRTNRKDIAVRLVQECYKKEMFTDYIKELRQEWSTPDYLFDYLDKIYNFKLDLAASKENSKCENFINKDDDALSDNPWLGDTRDKQSAFCNPPYNNIMPWLQKAAIEAGQNGSCDTVIFILPQELSSVWGRFCVNVSTQITFVVGGRVCFVPPDGIEETSPPKGTMIVEFSMMDKPKFASVDINELRFGVYK